MKVLLIEDNPIITHLIKIFLEDTENISHFQKYELISIKSLKEFSEFNLKDINVILLDLNLPDSEGLTTLVQVMKVTKLPIIVISGIENPDILRESIRLGAQDYLIKNAFDKELLLKTILFAYERNLRIQFDNDIIEVVSEVIKLKTDLKRLQEDFSDVKQILCRNQDTLN